MQGSGACNLSRNYDLQYCTYGCRNILHTVRILGPQQLCFEVGPAIHVFPWNSFAAAVPALSMGRVAAALGVTVVFAVAARRLRGVTTSGAVAGAIVSLMLYLSAGPGAFVTLVSVFLLTLAATRLGYTRKQNMGTAEQGDGRTASQVLANLSVAGAAALLFATNANAIFLLALVAALAEAAADTVSSEYGQAVSQRPRLLTTWQIVQSGTDGAVSLAGTLAGTTAGFIVSVLSATVGLLAWSWVVVSTGCAVMGMLLDSLLGASLERRRWLNNDAVNFLSTLMAAGAAASLGFLWQ
jgi:uncharacterized protein (TIGR00297 family)